MQLPLKRLLCDLAVSIVLGVSAGLTSGWLLHVLTRHLPL